MSRFDCIVVLGHSAREDDPVMQARVRKGVELYRAGLADCLIMSGRWSFKLRHSPPQRTEAEVMRDYAASLGVPPQAFLLEYESTDTLSNAYFTKVRFLMPLDWRRLCVVTTEEHNERALWLFTRVLGPEYDLEMRPAAAVGSLAEGLERNRRLLRQIQGALEGIADGDHDAIADLLFTRHPGYVDDPEATREVEAALL
ncbi:MAG TPA: YdcF family protein [Dehalococcoidia bacterium]|nr:YdcF family protein [Dehalococcoidia bacterium]